MNSRRDFLFKLAVSATTPAVLCGRALAQTPPPVQLKESDPLAKALGYKEDTTKVNATKYPKHANTQRCDGCATYTGKAGAATGPCTTVGGRVVTAAGWCSAFAVKK